MAPPAPLGGRLGRLKLAPSPRILSSAALKSSPEGPQLLLPLPPRSWGISFGSGGPPVSPCRHTQLIQPAGRSRSRGHIGVPRQGAFPVVSFQDCSYKTPRWGSKDRGLFTRSPEAGSPESWGGQGRAPSGGAKGGSFLLLQPLGPPASLGCGRILPVSASVVTRPSPLGLPSSYGDTSDWSRAHPRPL